MEIRASCLAKVYESLSKGGVKWCGSRISEREWGSTLKIYDG